MRTYMLAFILALSAGVAWGPAAATQNSPLPEFSQEQVNEAIHTEAQRLVEGFLTEFPGTLAAMPDNPYRDKMDRLGRLLADRNFQHDLVGVARAILQGADIATILKARYQGVWNEQYINEMIRLSLLFADVVTPLILEKLESPNLVVS
ncbi:MAG: hypothetical protein WBG37_17230 [Desulfobacterales bacterium]